nr:GDSL-type esterase/lipase family protein [Bradyrhizobium sp. 15]
MLTTVSAATAVVLVGTSAWTINEVGKNNRAILQLSERELTADVKRAQVAAAAFAALNTKIDAAAGAFAGLDTKIDHLKPMIGHEHSAVREFVIAGHLARAVSPVVVFGDSITEAAVLPVAICNHPIVNAGIGGAGVDQLLRVVPSLLDGKSPALVVLAIGTNDAYPTPGRERQFTESYLKLLQSLAPTVPKVVVANIPPVDPKGGLTVAAGIDANLIRRYNQLLPKLANDAGASFIDLNKSVSSEGATETLDGVHLAPSSLARWETATAEGIAKALGCSTNAGR